jgi:PAS domain S-box-containing protein
MPDRLDKIYQDLKAGRKDYMVEIDMEGKCTLITPDALAFLGYTKEECCELTVFDLVSEEHLELLVWSFADKPDAKSEYDINVVTKSGKRLPIRVRPVLVVKGGEVVRVKCHFTVDGKGK